MKIVPNFSTAMHNLNPADWNRSAKQKVLYVGAVSVVALTGLVALSNLPTAQALAEASTGICKLPAAWKYEQCSTSPGLADFSSNQELFWYGTRQMERAAESTLAFFGNAIVNLISSIAQDIVSGDAAYKNCLQNDGTFCGPSSLEGNFFYENCMRNGGSPVLCHHLR